MTIKKVYRAFITVTILSIITRIIGFIFKVYLSRVLGAELLGLYQISLSFFFLLLCITSTGIPNTLSRKTAENNNNPDKTYSYLSASLILSLSITLTILAIIFIFKDYLHLIFTDDRSIPIFLIMLPALISSAIYCVIRGYFWGKKEFLVFGITELAEESLKIILSMTILSLSFIAFTKDIGIAIAFTITDYICCSLLIVFYMVKKGKLKRPAYFYEILKSSTPITTTRITGSVMSSIIAVLLPFMLSRYGLTIQEATAHYGRAVGMAAPLLMSPNTITSAISVVLLPEIAVLKANRSDTIHKKVDVSLSFSIIISSIFLSLFLGLGVQLGDLFFKDIIAGKYIQVASLMMIPMCIASISNTMLNSLSMENKLFFNFVIGSVFMLLSITFLTKFMGVYSMAIGQLLMYIIISLLNLKAMKKVNFTKFKFMKTLIYCPIIAVVSAIFIKLIYNIVCLYLSLFLSVFISCTIGMIIMVLLLFVSGVIDIKLIYRFSKKIGLSKAKSFNF